MFEVLQGEIATVAGVHIEYGNTGALSGQDANIGVRRLLPPELNLCRVNTGGVYPIPNARVFAGFLALWVATRTMPLRDVVQWDDI
jgi:hypothetical protein